MTLLLEPIKQGQRDSLPSGRDAVNLLCAEPGSLYKNGCTSTDGLQQQGGHKREVAAAHQPKLKSQHRRRHAGHKERDLLETFSIFEPVFGKFVSRLRRTDAVHLHLRTQGYGHMRSHLAEQRAGRGLEDHRYAAAGDCSAAERDHHEPKRDYQRTDLKVGSVREPERRGARGRAARGKEERSGDQKHNGGRIEGPR